jgi:hypothetical protein
MKVDSAELSLVGNHQENQDRASIVMDTGSWLLTPVDGMGCHAEGKHALERCSFALAGLRS